MPPRELSRPEKVRVTDSAYIRVCSSGAFSNALIRSKSQQPDTRRRKFVEDGQSLRPRGWKSICFGLAGLHWVGWFARYQKEKPSTMQQILRVYHPNRQKYIWLLLMSI